MELKLVNTEYNFDCLGEQVKASLGFQPQAKKLEKVRKQVTRYV